MLFWDYLLSLHCAHFKAALVVLPCERHRQSSPGPQGAGKSREWRKGSQEAEGKHRWGLSSQGQGLSGSEDFKGVKPH